MERFPQTSRFERLRRLGAGSMGVVFEARDPERGLNVALKCLRSFDAQSVLRMKDEFRALRDLRHPNLVALGELIQEQGQWFFTMELIEGVDFLSFARGAAPPPVLDLGLDLTTKVDADESATVVGPPGVEPLPPVSLTPQVHQPRRAASFDEAKLRAALLGLAQGLSALHEAGKVHRDIKPSNVLVTPEGRAVLLDFGLTTDVDPRAQGLDEGFALGTPAYMAPEQSLGGAVGPPADWYSVGVMLYEVLVGQRPLAGAKQNVLMLKLRLEPPAPADLVDGVPPDLNRLCQSLLRIEPQARPTAAEVLATLGAPDRRQTRELPGRAGQGVFVGRSRELEVLRGALAQHLLGKPVLVVVQGDSGVGKSALIDAFLEQVQALAPDARVLRGKCHERESVPYKAFDGVVDSLTRQLSALGEEGARAVLPPSVGLVGQVFPVLQQLPEVQRLVHTATVAPDAQEQRGRFFQAVRDLLRRLGEAGPVLLALEDVQWADPDSISLLRAVLRLPGPPRTMLLCSVRAPAAAEPWLPPGARSLGRFGQHLLLSPLPDDDAKQLARALLAADGPAATAAVDWVAAEGQGHPLFIQELVWNARSRPSGGRLPLDETLWQRVQQLPAAARDVLCLVAVAGSPVVNEAVSGAARLEAEPYAKAVDALSQAQLLRVNGVRRRDAVEPFHDRIREAVLQRLTSEERRSCHERLARLHQALGTADAETLSVHWLEAGEPALARRYVLQAAAAADVALAFERAARLYRQALALTAEQPELRAERVRLLMQLGESLTNAGRSKDAGGAYLQAARLADPIDAIELHRLAGSALLRSGQVSEGLAALDLALGAFGLALPRSRLGTLVALVRERSRLAVRGVSFRERPAEEVPTRDLRRIDVLWSIATGLTFVETTIGAVFSAQHLRLALDAGEPQRVARALCLDYPYQEAITQASLRSRRSFETGRALAERVDDPLGVAASYLNEAAAQYSNEGRFREVLSLCKAAEDIFLARCRGVAWELAVARTFSNSSLFCLGEWAELSRRVKTQLPDAQAREDFQAITCLTMGGMNVVWLMDDDPEGAARVVGATLARWPRERILFPHFLGLVSQSQIDVYAERPGEAVKRIDKQWKPLARTFHLKVPIIRYLLFEALVRGLLACAKGASGARREALWRRVEEVALQLGQGSLPWLGAAQALALGALAAQRGDAARAKDKLEAAERGFAQQQMRVLAAAARCRRGALVGGEAGQALLTTGREALLAQDIRAPEKMLGLLAPGF